MNQQVNIIQLTDTNNNFFGPICDWNYIWWGEEEGYTYEQFKEHFSFSLNTGDKLPQTYVAVMNNEVVGMYRINSSDSTLIRPDIYPLLSSVYVDKKHRNKGIGKILLEHSKEIIKKLKIKEIFLYTNLEGFYEKFGWEYIGDVNTFDKEDPICRLYVYKN